MFRWLKRRSRDRLRQSDPPAKLNAVVETNLWQYPLLSESEQEKLRGDAIILAAEKNWEGCGGLDLTEEMKLTIAAQIALQTLGFEEQFFDKVLSILVYPSPYRATQQSSLGGGVVIERDSTRMGEAWYRGPVILSWPDVLDGGRSPNHGHQVVIHEFAHQLDLLNARVADGIPPMSSKLQAQQWLKTCEASYDRLVQACQNGYRPLIDCYGATNRAEFFAVASEAFFQAPRHLAHADFELFEVLRDYYGQDSRRWAT